jgi:vitamin B12 transporter
MHTLEPAGVPGAMAVLSLSLTLASGAVRAAAPAGDPTDPMNEIVVTATRVAQPARQLLEPVILIGRDALADSLATDLGEVLRYYAGLDLGRSGGPGQPLSLFIRGANSDQSIVMIDGVRINPGTFGGAPLQDLAPELFERVEIVKGPRSAIYGTDAIGGVVNLITRRAGASGADAMVGYGRYGSGEFACNGQYAGGDGSVQAALTGQRSNGFPTFAADSVDRGFKNLSGTVSAAATIEAVELGAFYYRSTGTSEYAEPVYNSDFTAFASFTPASERFSNSAYAVHAGGQVSERWHARVSLSRIVDDLRQDQLDPYSPNLERDHDHTSRDTLELQDDLRLASGPVTQLVTFGALISSERTNSLSFGTGYAVGTHTDTYYLQDQLESGRHRLLVAGGYYRHPAFGDHATWGAEYGYALTRDTLLTAAAGTAFRAPSATERFGYGGTPGLLPESSRNLELGIKSRLGASQQLALAAFQDTIDDLIVFVPDPSNAVYGGENRNINRARIRGFEASWELREDPWSLRTALTRQDPRDLTAGSALLRRSRLSVTLSGSRRMNRGEFGLELLQSGPRQDIDAVSGAAVRDGGYLLAAVRFELSLAPDWSVTARVDNALDRRYQLANGYNTAGRAVAVATRYNFH